MKVTNEINMLEIPANIMGKPKLIHPTLICDSKAVILVDSGFPGQLHLIREEMAKAGVSLSRLDKVIITHHDLDHVGSLEEILDEKLQNIEVFAHELEQPFIQDNQPPTKLARLKASLDSLPEELKVFYYELKEGRKTFSIHIKVDQTLSDRDELPYCGGMTVIHTPGHTPGHICLYIKRYKLLIAGDSLSKEGNNLVTAPEYFDYDREMALKSLKKLSNYDIETVICYHGGLYQNNPNEYIAKLAAS